MGRPAPASLAPVLGGFVDRLHRTPLGEVEELVGRDPYPPRVWLKDAERAYRRIAARIPAAKRGLVEDFLGRPAPAEPGGAVLCHNDLGAEHVLVDATTETITGVIDWADTAIADPARDFARVYRDLGPGFCDSLLDHYGGPWDGADQERTAFYARCSAIEDIAFGFETGVRAYAAHALAHLDRTFG